MKILPAKTLNHNTSVDTDFHFNIKGMTVCGIIYHGAVPKVKVLLHKPKLDHKIPQCHLQLF